MIRFIADSGIDIEKIEGVDFSRVPLTISTGNKDYVDVESLDKHQMIEDLLAYKGRSFTACPSVDAWMKAFGEDTDEIPEEIYVVTLTSGLSGTYDSAVLAKNTFLEKYPDTKILVVDSKSVGPEMVLIMRKMVELKQAGCSFEEVQKKITEYQKHTRLIFAFQSIHNLVQNGRVSKLVAVAAGVLGISVMGTASEEGTIKQTGKGRGDRRVIAGLLKDMKAYGYAGGKVAVSQTENEELAQKFIRALHEEYPDVECECNATAGLCSYYCERGGFVVGFETK